MTTSGEPGGYAPSLERRKIGHITPSSNTVIEPMTTLISRPLDALVSHHFTRIKVEAISLDTRHTGQFSVAPMLAAAELLADAGVDAIVWNGTSGGWNGIEADDLLCEVISAHTGIPATTTTLAQLEVLDLLELRRCALALPYTEDVALRIAATFAGAGVAVTGWSAAGVSDNRSMAHVSAEEVLALVRGADSLEAEAVAIFCTGVAGAHLVPVLEAELGKPVFDSVALTLWKALAMVGIEAQLPGWGELLSRPALGAGVP